MSSTLLRCRLSYGTARQFVIDTHGESTLPTVLSTFQRNLGLGYGRLCAAKLMPIPAILKEKEWKSECLPLRSAAEKTKKPKTGISEALRAYEKAETLPIHEAGKKGKALRELTRVLGEAVKNHSGNAKLKPILNNMLAKVTQERERLREEIRHLTIDEIFHNKGLYDGFYSHTTKAQGGENLDFLDAVNHHTSGDVLYRWYFAPKAEKEVNIPHALKDALTRNHNDQQAIARAVAEITALVKQNYLQPFTSELANQI